MRNPTGQTVSVWNGIQATVNSRDLSPNRRATPSRFDAAVIGGGLAGLTSAYLLAREGKSVVLFEQDEIGSGESGRTTAHVATAIDDRYTELERLHGEEASRRVAASQVRALELIEEIIARESIVCDSRRVPGYLFLGPEHDEKLLKREHAAALRAGLRVELTEPLVKMFSDSPWLLFHDQLQFQPVKYMRGLADAFTRLGGVIRTHCHVDAVEWEEEDLARVILSKQANCDSPIEVTFVVTATHTPFIDRFAMHTKQAPYRSYAIAARIPRESLPNALFWDTSDPYHYIRLERDADAEFERVIIGGEDHKVGQDHHPEMCWKRLETWARKRLPEIREVTHRWSGQIMEPVDAVAYAGRNPLDSKNSYIITGDSGNGVTNTAIGAEIVVDLIMDRPSPYAEIYTPNRTRLSSAGEYLKENLNVVAQYSDHFQASEVDSIANIARGQGAVVRVDGKPVAVHRDNAGRIRACSAICPHLGAVLHWNSAERSWDCPAHGSRFDCDGKVLNGPSAAALDRRNLAEKPKTASDLSSFTNL